VRHEVAERRLEIDQAQVGRLDVRQAERADLGRVSGGGERERKAGNA